MRALDLWLQSTQTTGTSVLRRALQLRKRKTWGLRVVGRIGVLQMPFLHREIKVMSAPTSRPLVPHIGAEVIDVDLARACSSNFEQIRAVWQNDPVIYSGAKT